MKCSLLCLGILSSCWFCALFLPDLTPPILSLRNRSPLIGSIWSPVYCEIWSGDTFIFVLAFILEIIIITRRSGIFPPLWWCRNHSTSTMVGAKFISPHLELAGLISMRLRGCDQKDGAEIKWKSKCCLITWTFWMGIKWQARNRSNFNFHSSQGRGILPSCRMYTPRYFHNFLKSKEGIEISPHYLCGRVITFTAGFPSTGSAHKLPHLPTKSLKIQKFLTLYHVKRVFSN